MNAAQDPLIHTLFSCQASFNVAPPPPRKVGRPNSATSGGGSGDVPRNTEGLRILAAEGSWIDLLDLAQNLERELVRANQQNVANAAQMQRQGYMDGAVLQLILTRVTAYTKMNDFGRAVQVLQSIPFDKIPEQEIPFSLSFLKSFLPMLLSTSSAIQIAASQNALYATLAKIENEMNAILDVVEKDQQHEQRQQQQQRQHHDPIALLEHRRFRVTRALFVGHLRCQELATATTLLQTNAKFHADRRDRLLLHLKHSSGSSSSNKPNEFSENIFTTSHVISKASPEFSSSQKLSLKSAEHLKRLIENAEMEQLLCLQQALCLSLYAGNAPLAHSLRKSIETLPITCNERTSERRPRPQPRRENGTNPATTSSSSSSSPSSSSSSSSDDDDGGGGNDNSSSNNDDANRRIRRAAKKKSETRHLKELAMCLNDSLLDVFFDRPADAASRLYNVVGTFLLDPSNTVLPPALRSVGKYGHLRSVSVVEEKSSTGSSMILPFYLEPARSIHVQHQFLSICLTVVALVPHAIHAPPPPSTAGAASQRAPASVESKRPQNAPETTALCNAALDRLATAVPHLVLRMPAFHTLVAQVRASMQETQAATRRQVYQSVLSYLVAGRESIASLC